MCILFSTIAYCVVGCNTGAADRQSLHLLACDTESGSARIVQSCRGFQGSTYFQLDASRTHLYSMVGEKTAKRTQGVLVRFPLAKDADGVPRIGGMERLADLPCETPCHVALSPDDSLLSFASYLSGTAGTLDLRTRTLSTFVFPNDDMGPNRPRQPKAYAHCCFYGQGDRVGVVDLGCDRIWFFDPKTMRRDESISIKAARGDGPRHVVWSKDGRHLFVVNELGSSVTTWRFDGRAWKAVGTWSTLPDGFDRFEKDRETLSTKAAAIKLTADGKVLMASNRGCDSIAFFDVDEPTGRLTRRNIAKLRGRFPRDFELMPGEKFMVVGHKMSDEVQVYRFDRGCCTLEPIGEPLAIWRPLCFKFL